MARALLADPDLPRKWRDGQEAQVVRCIYGNVCKTLDENFKKVICALWPAGALHAPRSADGEPPTWNADGARLRAESGNGRVTLRWQRAHDNEAVYGYEVFRAVGDGAFTHLYSARDPRVRFDDHGVVSGERYRYYVRPYDLAGNRGESSDTVEATLS
jgi:hypothetical protein